MIKMLLINMVMLLWTGTDKEMIRAEPFDVIINELMVRPSPSIGLPEAEYIELFNRSDKTLNLDRWTVSVGSRSRSLPEHILSPGGFLLITHENNVEKLSEFGDVAGLPAFPVLAMGGQKIVLRDEKGNVISAIRYSDKWYECNLKSSGGWALEQIDPFNPCGGNNNWTASKDNGGGTPGRVNSVYDNNPDNIMPELKRASINSGGSLRLHFTKQMHPLSGWSPSDYSAEGLGQPLWVMPSEPFFESVDLFFHHKFEEDRDYTLKVKGNLYDCAGNIIDSNTSETRFTIPVLPGPEDIVINEILFNPFPGGVNFIELVNISTSTFDLKQVIVAGMNNGEPDPAYILTRESYLLFPEEYVVLTTCPETVKSHYYIKDPNSFISMERIPKMNNESGRLVIAGLQLNIIDDMEYSSDMHSPLLTDRKGISLERINYNRPASDPTNWLSASEMTGFATPGYKNSQYSEITNISSNILEIDPKIFSPDNSGYNDVVNISYKLNKPGYTGNITIFDSRGRPVRRLVRNKLLGTSGVYSWDGRNEANSQSRLGIYLILMELLHPDGEVRKYKETVVLGGRLRGSGE